MLGSVAPLGPAPTSTSTASGMRVISPTSPAPTLNSTGRLSHRLLAQGVRPLTGEFRWQCRPAQGGRASVRLGEGVRSVSGRYAWTGEDSAHARGSDWAAGLRHRVRSSRCQRRRPTGRWPDPQAAGRVRRGGRHAGPGTQWPPTGPAGCWVGCSGCCGRLFRGRGFSFGSTGAMRPLRPSIFWEPNRDSTTWSRWRRTLRCSGMWSPPCRWLARSARRWHDRARLHRHSLRRPHVGRRSPGRDQGRSRPRRGPRAAGPPTVCRDQSPVSGPSRTIQARHQLYLCTATENG